MKLTGKIRSRWCDAYAGKPIDVPKELYNKILNTFTLVLLQAIIKYGITYKLPHRLGYFGVKKRKTNSALINWKLSKEQNTLIPQKLFHSEGWRAGFYWDKKRSTGANFTFSNIWRFRPNKFAKKALSQEIILNNTITKYYT